MSDSNQEYAPFKGLTAWFSSSVHPSFVRRWREFGGTCAREREAQFLFSDDAFAEDTIRVYGEHQDVCLFLSSWILEVIRTKSSPRNTPIGQHCLQPHYLIQQNHASADPYTTPPPSGKEKRFGSWMVQRVGGRGKERSDQSVRSTGRKDCMEDSQQYLTEGVVTSEGPASVGGASLIITSDEYFFQLEKQVKTRATNLVHIDDHQVHLPPLPLTDFSLHSGGYTMHHIR